MATASCSESHHLGLEATLGRFTQTHNFKPGGARRGATGLNLRAWGSSFAPSVSLGSFTCSFKFHLEPPASWSREYSGEKANQVRALWQLELQWWRQPAIL